MLRRTLFGFAVTSLAAATLPLPALAGTSQLPPATSFHRADIGGGQRIFYREAGSPAAPTILLLHGFPTSSHMFRDLIPILAPRYHVIAPDLPGFGFSDTPDRASYGYTFDHLARDIDQFTSKLGLTRYALYIFDYGAPVGLRLAMAHPERVTAIVSQNGNAYEAGLGGAWNPIQRYWHEPTDANRQTLRAFLKIDGTRLQYETGVHDPSQIAPESYTLDQALLDRPGEADIQLDLFLDYRNNITLYPRFHDYFRAHKPPLLAVWGNGDPFFIPAGAEAFKQDLPDAEVHFFPTGHFALETQVREIGPVIVGFLDRVVAR